MEWQPISFPNDGYYGNLLDSALSDKEENAFLNEFSAYVEELHDLMFELGFGVQLGFDLSDISIQLLFTPGFTLEFMYAHTDSLGARWLSASSKIHPVVDIHRNTATLYPNSFEQAVLARGTERQPAGIPFHGVFLARDAGGFLSQLNLSATLILTESPEEVLNQLTEMMEKGRLGSRLIERNLARVDSILTGAFSSDKQ